MNRRTVLKASLLTTAAASAGSADAGSALLQAEGPGGARYAEAVRAIAAEVERHRRENALPGLTLCAVDADGWTLTIDSGFADVGRRTPLRPGRLFQVGSISKSITALAVWRAAEAGRLSLDQDARTLLPGAPWPDAKITVTQLLDHSSGLPEDAPIFPRGGAPGQEGRLWLGFQPGTYWAYSNLGFDLLGRMLERLHGRRLGAILETEVLRPMGLPSAAGAILTEDRDRYPVGYAPYQADRPYPTRGALAPGPWTDVAVGSGCVAASGREMAAYLRFLVGAANGRGAGVLSDAGAARFCRPTIDAPDWHGGGRYGSGLATVEIAGRKLLHHTGGMLIFNSAFHVDPKAGVGCFASTNVGDIEYRPRDLTAYATSLLSAVREGPPPSPPDASASKPAVRVAGVWQAADGSRFTLTGEADGPTMASGGVSASVERVDDAQWLSHHPRFQRYVLVAERGAGGKGPVSGFWYGERFYAAPGVAQPPPAAADLQVLAGRYESNDPWSAGTVRLVARHDGLWLNGTAKLAPAGDGGWRVSERDWAPERLRFEAPLDGRHHRLVFSGQDLLRVEEPADG